MSVSLSRPFIRSLGRISLGCISLGRISLGSMALAWMYATLLLAQEQGGAAPDSSPDGSPATPASLRIDFESPESWGGGMLATTEGPRPPLYPSFPADNRAGLFTAKTAAPKFVDGGARIDLRFGLDDSLTLEAWVRPDAVPSGAYVYLIGKGRNGRQGYSDKNQNYALRLKGDSAGAKLNFLFGSLAAGGQPDDAPVRKWHRWTSREALPNDRPWHHVAISYTFGKADSLKAVIDGKETAGDWDMDGKTSAPPATDDDDLSLGDGNGGGAGNRFVGALDQVAIHRGVVPLEELKRRFSFSPQPPSIDLSQLPPGKVLVEICEEGLASSSAWPAQSPAATERFETPAFGVVDVPTKYVDSGIRGDRPNPFLLRTVAKVKVPAGKHRWLLRARGLTRLYIDDQALLTLAPMKGDSGGHGLVPRVDEYLNLGVDFRFAPPGTQEAWKEWEVEAGEHLVVMETIVGGALGGAKVRPELGETVVAVSRQGESTWSLLGTDFAALPYDDAYWSDYAQARRAELRIMDAQRRAALRAEFLKQRQPRLEAARRWLAETAETPVPPLPPNYPAFNPIDHFLAARIEQIRQQDASAVTNVDPAERVDFFRDIQPIFETVCWDCHKGGKAQGGLNLESLAHAQVGGDSGSPAVTPGMTGASELLARVESSDEATRMPPRGERLLAQQVALLKRWIEQGARWPELKVDHFELTSLCDDLTFLRRATLDTVGVLPTADEIAAFEADASPDKRRRAIDRLLADERTADHAMGYWLDVLAENPNILNPTLNNTGPFRWWLYESFVDDKPLDMLVEELVEMRGSERFGGPAGFGVASQNDSPFAAKATIVSSAFLGVEMKCARCHDAPAHESRQEQLFQLAAMLASQPLEVPATSSVPLDKLTEGGRKPLIQVTLKPGAKIEPAWPFERFGVAASPASAASATPTSSRSELARLLTAPENERFAQVSANRIWARLMGRGIVEPVEDWERGVPTHPELLRWLGRELVRGEYQPKHVMRLIMNSHAYQRAADARLTASSPLYTAPAVRRLSAEQIVDSLFAAAGKTFRLEEVSLDIDGRRDLKNSISLGIPRRAWMLTSTSNERDRPSLALPRVQAIVDVLQAFGWRGARQDPASHRDTAPNALQPAILSNGVAGVWLTRLSDDHGLTKLALESETVEQLVEQLYLRMLTRRPTEGERRRVTSYLADGFDARRAAMTTPTAAPVVRQPERYVSWSNHLDPEATVIRQQQEAAARRGDPPTSRLVADWRERLEDVVWTLVNSPEVAFTR